MLTLLLLAQLTLPEMKGTTPRLPPPTPLPTMPAGELPGAPSIRRVVLNGMGFFTAPGVELPEGFVPIPRPGMGASAAEQIAAVCGGAPIPSRNILLDREYHQSLLLSFRDTRREARTDLSCTRALLSTSDAYGRESFQMLEGTSWNRGAITSALYALAQRPDDRRAADVLALVTLMARKPRDLDRIAHVLGAAVRLGVRSSPALRGCSELAYRVDDTLDVRTCANAALAAGLDSSWHLLRLGRVHFDASDAVKGQEYFLAAVAAARGLAGAG